MKNFNKFFITGLLVLSLVMFFQKNSLATMYTIHINILGSQEVPPSTSTGVGALDGTYDDGNQQLVFDMFFTGLSAGTTAAHFHGPANIGVNAPIQIGFAGFPTGVTSGGYSNTYTLTLAQETQLLGGLWYVNIHTTGFPGGEIRGQLIEGTLPVELSSFAANVLKGNVTLNWSTASETNNAGFDIERKISSSPEWTKIGNVAGNGNTNEVKNYSFTSKVNSGVYTYRLKQIDYNGNFEYFYLSSEVNVGVPSAFNLTQNYPNPFNPTTKIDYELPIDANVNITLYDISGKEVMNVVNESKTAGYYTVQLNAANLSSGTYFYNINAGNFTQTKKLTVLK